MKRLLIFAICGIFCFDPGSVVAQSSSVEDFIIAFTGNEWIKVDEAREQLENLEDKALPHLFKLLEDTSYIKLRNTFDLIYPGAEEFYGHGYIIDYDIDFINIRSGWLIERLTFQNFGFRQPHIKEEQLFQYMKRHYADYLKNGSYNIELKDSTSVISKKFLKRIAIHNACLWWQKNQVGWKRLQALVNALKSNDPQRQADAINFLRFGDTKCTGLTKEYYLQNILPVISNLTTSKDELVSEQAQYLFSDREYYYWWYEFNPKRKIKH